MDDRGFAMTEEWRELVSYPGYEVSSYGNVRRGCRVLYKRLLKGYPGVSLQRLDGSWKTETVHALVAQSFIGPVMQYLQ